MKPVFFIIIFFAGAHVFGQHVQEDLYGFRHLQTVYKGDTVDILVKSKKGDEMKQKPLLLFCQGSLPVPLIIKYATDSKQGIYNVFVFNPDSLSVNYHLAIVSKPYVPLVADQKSLNADLTYSDSTGKFPQKYIERNLLDYYVDRNIAMIKFLQEQKWVSKKELVVAGHSEGSTIAAKIAFKFSKVTQLIYSGGNPLGRILSVIERSRANENEANKVAENMIAGWERVVEKPDDMDATTGDTNKATFDFSIPPIQYLQDLKIPVLVCYGTKDVSCAYNDYLRIEMIRQQKKNFSFKTYIGTEHNYFPLKSNGEIDYDIFNWDKVADDWRSWLLGK